VIPADDPRHGTHAGYRAGCRCDPCRAGSAAYRRSLYNRHYIEGHVLIDSTGTRRRIEALVALGYTWEAIDAALAEVTGKSRARGHSNRRHLVFKGGGKITRDNAAEYAAVYDRLSMRLPEMTCSARRARTRAARLGWLVPLAWDEGRIDDPAYKPAMRSARKHRDDVDEAVVLRVLSGERLDTTPAERAAVGLRRDGAALRPRRRGTTRRPLACAV
jgi:hypothetical protein